MNDREYIEYLKLLNDFDRYNLKLQGLGKIEPLTKSQIIFLLIYSGCSVAFFIWLCT
jgi:hypothetical protein